MKEKRYEENGTQLHSTDCQWREEQGVRHSDAGYGECECKCHEIIDSVKDKKWTIEEGIEECNAMEQGKGEFVRDDNDYNKPGDIRNCHDCGTPVDVVTYGSYALDVMSITFCPKHQEEFNPSKCTSNDCEVHGGENGFDEVKYIKESAELDKTIKTIREAIEKIKPRSDSILEFDRVKTIVEHGCFAYGHPDSFDFWFFDQYINYLGLKGMLK